MPRRAEAMAGGMGCEQVLGSLEAALDGELAAAQATAVEAHLAACPACAAEHGLATAMRRELRALPELDAPAGVLRKIRRDVASASRFGARRRHWASLAAALFAAAVLGAGLWWNVQRPAPRAGGEGREVAEAVVVARATEEARYALAYLTRVHRRAGLKLRDDLFVDRVARPTARGLARSLSPSRGNDVGAGTHGRRHDRS